MRNWPKELGGFLLLSFLTRLPLLGWFNAERTDSIILITLFENKSSYWPPLYSSLLYLFNLLLKNPILSGRIVSLFSSILSLIPLYFLARYLFNRETAKYSSLLYIFSPLPFIMGLRVLTDSLFLLFFLSALYFYFLSLEGKDRISPFLFGIFSGLSVLTRYQGFIFLPFILHLLITRRSKKLPLLLGIISWIGIILWIYQRGFGHVAQYGERMGGMNIREFLLWGEGFFFSLFYVLTYPVAFLSLYAIFTSSGARERKFVNLILLLFFLWFPPHIFFHSFQLRYFLPVISLLLILAGEGVRKSSLKKVWLPLGIISSLILTLLSLSFQRDSFGDIQRSAEWVKENIKIPYIYSDEYWKTRFWSGKKIKPWVGEAKAGDILVLHSGYSYLSREFDALKKKYRYRVLYTTSSRIIPFLPDILNPPQWSNSPYWVVLKFTPQKFSSFVIEIYGKKE